MNPIDLLQVDAENQDVPISAVERLSQEVSSLQQEISVFKKDIARMQAVIGKNYFPQTTEDNMPITPPKCDPTIDTITVADIIKSREVAMDNDVGSFIGGYDKYDAVKFEEVSEQISDIDPGRHR